MNEIYCKLTKEFPLTADEKKTIESVRALTAPTSGALRQATMPVAPVKKTDQDKTQTVGSAPVDTQAASAAGEAPVRSIRSILDPIKNFFGRIFGR